MHAIRMIATSVLEVLWCAVNTKQQLMGSISGERSNECAKAVQFFWHLPKATVHIYHAEDGVTS